MSDFPTLYQQWRRKAIAAGYPRCTDCSEPVQKEYQTKGTLCRRCTERKIAGEPPVLGRFPDGVTDAVAYERGEDST